MVEYHPYALANGYLRSFLKDWEHFKILIMEEMEFNTLINSIFPINQVNEGKVPEDRVALRMLAEEMMQWPNLEVLSKTE